MSPFRQNMMRVLILTITGIFYVHCSPKKEMEVRIDNIMCRVKPDINSKTVKIFNKGTLLTTKPTTVEFTFMDKTDVWHEVPDMHCFVFGGLLTTVATDSNSSRRMWRIQETIKNQYHMDEPGEIRFRKEIYTKAECEEAVKKQLAEWTRKAAQLEKDQEKRKKDCENRGVDWVTHASECGVYLEGQPDPVLLCIQK